MYLLAPVSRRQGLTLPVVARWVEVVIKVTMPMLNRTTEPNSLVLPVFWHNFLKTIKYYLVPITCDAISSSIHRQ